MVELYAEKTLKIKLDATVVFVTLNQIKDKSFNFRNSEIEKNITRAFSEGRFDGKRESILTFNIGKPIIVIGLGEEKDLTPTYLRITVKHLFDSKLLEGVRKFELVPHKDAEPEIRGYCDGCLVGTYRWDKYITEKKESSRIIKLVSRFEDFVWNHSRVCDGVNFARDLVNENADVKNSEYLENVVRDLVRKSRDITLTILDERHMKKLGMNLFLAVNSGSKYAPKLIIAEYKGGRKGDQFTAILGKGLTFDSGGLNLKPSGFMETMRQDMSGTAAVIGTLRNIIELKPNKNIIFACAIAENAISRDAYKPGDVYTAYNKKHVEIGNTDAEGRLVLADSIAYITKKYNVEKIIDVATLTSSVVIALGNDHIGLMTNSDKLGYDLLECGEETNELVWQLPIYPELKDHLKSKYADIRSIGLKRKAGSISAGEFLRNFVDDGVSWAHLDIAGTAFVECGEYWYYNYGATGSGVRLLTEYILKF